MRPQYTVTLGYDPTGQGWTGGLVEDVPRTIAEHAVYRKLKEKAAQHRGVPGPDVVCLGSDRSPALSRAARQSGISRDDAVNAAFARWPHITAVIVVSIEAKPVAIQGITYSADSWLYLNPASFHSLTFERS